MKRIALLFVTCLFSMASFAEIINSGTKGDISWTLDDEGILMISGEGEISASLLPLTLKETEQIKQVIISEGITAIGDNFFNFGYYNNIKNVQLPNSLQTIGFCAFTACKFTTMVIPESVTTIKVLAFAKLGAVDTLFYNAKNCIVEGMQDWSPRIIVIGKEVVNIPNDLFGNWRLEKLIVPWNNPENIIVGENLFDGVDKSQYTLIVPAGTKALYQQAEVWQDFIIIEQINAEITPDAIISWQPVEDAADYQLILFSDEVHTDTLRIIHFDADGNFVPEEQLRSGNTEDFSYPIPDLSAATTYFYTLRAFQDDKTIALQNGTFTTIGETTSVPGLSASSVKVYAIARTIFAENIQDENIALYNTQGQLLTAKQNVNGVFQADVPQAGVYVVRVGGEVWKVIVK